MRVYEIITEEGILAKGLGLAVKAFGGPARSAAMEKLAGVWAEELAKSGKLTTRPGNVVSATFAKDGEFLKAARAKAIELSKKVASKSANAEKMAILKVSAGAFASKLNTLAKWGIATAPIVQYNIRMSKWEKQLESGEITQAEYEQIRQKEMATMVTQMAASIGGLAVFKSFSMGSKFLLGWIPGFKATMTGLTTAGAAAMAYWWSTDEGRSWLSKLIINEFVDLSPILGGVPLAGIDWLKSKIPGFNSEKTPGGSGGQGGAETGTTTPTPAGPTVSAQQKPQPGSLAGSGLKAVDIKDPEGKDSFDITWNK